MAFPHLTPVFLLNIIAIIVVIDKSLWTVPDIADFCFRPYPSSKALVHHISNFVEKKRAKFFEAAFVQLCGLGNDEQDANHSPDKVLQSLEQVRLEPQAKRRHPQQAILRLS